MLSASADSKLKVWDLIEGRPFYTLRGHTGTVTTAAFSPDGLRLVTACSDGSARLWTTDTGKLLAVMRRHAGPLRSV